MAARRRMPRPGRYVDHDSPRGYALDYSDWTTGAGPARLGLVDPARLARAALGSLELYLSSGADAQRDWFLDAARWLCRNHEEIPGGFLSWPVAEPPRAYAGHLSPGWLSGAVHAECVAVLVRAHVLFRMAGAEETLGRAIGAFRTPVEDGGFLREVGEDGGEGGLVSAAFVETFPIDDRPSLVLTGHLRAMLAVNDHSVAFGDPSVTETLRRLERGLLLLIDRYDTGSWTLRDLDASWRTPAPASRNEHGEHILLLDAVGGALRNDELRAKARSWSRYTESPAARSRAAWHRRVFRALNPDPRSR